MVNPITQDASKMDLEPLLTMALPHSKVPHVEHTIYVPYMNTHILLTSALVLVPELAWDTVF